MSDKISGIAGRLYYEDSHIHEFDAVVTGVYETKDGAAVTLDRTAFFPGGGGQNADTGYIGTARVTDVKENGGEILHFAAAPLNVGEKYSCSLDWEQRYRRMQNHSGEHIVSGISHTLHGVENVGFHMGGESMTIDFDKELTWDELMEIEKRANEAVRADIPVTAFFPGSGELASMDYRSKLELTHDVRIVDIPGVDRCACCAPHVYRTGEVGLIKILDFMRHRGGIRVTLVCGMDALDTVRIMQENITAVSQLLSAKRHECGKAVGRVLSDAAKQKERISALSMELARLKAESTAETEGNICVFDNVLDDIALRELVNMLTGKCGSIAAAFSGSDEAGYNYIIGSKSIDLRANSKAINAGIGGRGGGSREMIQGRAALDKETISNFFKSFNA